MMTPAEFSGTATMRRALPAFLLESLRYRAGQSVPPHYHATAAIVLLASGGCALGGNGGRLRPLSSGAAVLHPAGEVHSYRYDTNCDSQMLAITVPSDICERLRAEVDLDRPRVARAPQLVLRLRQRLEQPRTSMLSLESAVFELLAALCNRGGDAPAPRALARARALLHDRFNEALTLTDIAHAVELPPLQLARHFRSHFGLSPGAYLRKLRIEYACQRLAASEIAIVDLAQELGFFDQSHFCHTFTQQTGMTPSAYRRLHSRR